MTAATVGFDLIDIEGILQPLKPRSRGIDIAHGKDVETQSLRVPLRIAHQEMACRKNDFALLSPVDTFYRGGEAILFTSPNFHNDNRCSVSADKIQFAQPAVISLFENSQSTCLEIVAGCGLPGAAGYLSIYPIKLRRARLSEVCEFCGGLQTNLVLNIEGNRATVAKLSQRQATMDAAFCIQA